MTRAREATARRFGTANFDGANLKVERLGLVCGVSEWVTVVEMGLWGFFIDSRVGCVSSQGCFNMESILEGCECL